jgi:hypothetical protein
VGKKNTGGVLDLPFMTAMQANAIEDISGIKCRHDVSRILAFPWIFLQNSDDTSAFWIRCGHCEAFCPARDGPRFPGNCQERDVLVDYRPPWGRWQVFVFREI